MSRRTNAVSGEEIIAKWGTDEYELAYLILKNNLTVLDPPKIPIFKRFLKSRYLTADSKRLLDIIQNDPWSLRQKLFLLSEVKKIAAEPDLSSKYEEGSEPGLLGCLLSEDDTSAHTEPRTAEEAESEPSSAKLRYSLGGDASEARSLPKEARTALGITEESLLKGAIEAHENEIRNSPNVFSLIGKVWFVKFAQEEWGLFPDQEKYKYIANLLSLSNDGLKKDELEYSIHNVDLMLKVKGKGMPEEYQSDNTKEHLSKSDLSEILTEEELKSMKNVGYELLTELKEARETGDQELVDEAQDKIDRYRSYVLNEYGIKTVISKDETRFSYNALHRPGKENEKIRQLVKNQINNAIKDLKDHMPMFGRHLRHSLKTKLYETLYSPENHIAWHISM